MKCHSHPVSRSSRPQLRLGCACTRVCKPGGVCGSTRVPVLGLCIAAGAGVSSPKLAVKGGAGGGGGNVEPRGFSMAQADEPVLMSPARTLPVSLFYPDASILIQEVTQKVPAPVPDLRPRGSASRGDTWPVAVPLSATRPWGPTGTPKRPGTTLSSSVAPAVPGCHNQHSTLWEQIFCIKSPPDTRRDGIPQGWGSSGTSRLDFP